MKITTNVSVDCNGDETMILRMFTDQAIGSKETMRKSISDLLWEVENNAK